MQKNRQLKILVVPKRVIAATALLILVMLSLQPGKLLAQAITQGYRSDTPMQRGMIVQLDENDTSKIMPVSQDTAEATFGVVVNPNDAAATLSTDTEQIFVATSGKYEVLVSDQNGDIEPSDYIVVSSLNGVGMKVNDEQAIVVARALEGFSREQVIGSAKVGEQEVRIGRILADIDIVGNPLEKKTLSYIPEILKDVAEEIAGKPVDPARVYISLIVIVVSALISGSLMYSAIHSAIISIGRNPLSKKSIMLSMYQVVAISLFILIVGLFGVYLILRL